MLAVEGWEWMRRLLDMLTEPTAVSRPGWVRWPARLRYLAGMLHAFREFSPLQVRAEFVATDTQTIEGEALLAAAFNTPSYGSGVRLAPEARLDDGYLDVVFVKDLSLFQVLS